MASEERKFKIHVITTLDIAALKIEQRHNLSNAIVNISSKDKWWIAGDGLRYSLIKCFSLPGDIVCGWITQQHVLEQHLYDDEKHETKRNVESYDDRFFAILLGQNSVIFEWRQFRNKPPLTLPAMVERMELILSEVVKTVDINVTVKLDQVDKETTKDEFIKLFYEKEYQMVQVAVEQFGTETIPPNVILVNPNKHLEGAARELVQHDVLHPSLSKLIAEAKEEKDADLKKSAFTRAAIHSGQPVFIKYKDNLGQVKVRKKTEKGEIEVHVPVSETDSIESRIAIASSVINAVQKIDMGTAIDNVGKVDKQLDIFRQLEKKDED